MAMQGTEEQVFEPEGHSLAWTINNKLVSCYQLGNVEAYLKSPDLTNFGCSVPHAERREQCCRIYVEQGGRDSAPCWVNSAGCSSISSFCPDS